MYLKSFFIAASLLTLVSCQSTYFSALESVGIHKREILIDRIEDAQEAQVDGQEQFKNALERFKSVVNFDGGELEENYTLLNDEFEQSEKAATTIRERIDSVDSVAEALFEEWESELDQYTNTNLRRDSLRQLKDTQRRYGKLLSAMRKAEKSIDPVLNTLRDNVLYLKHNLNARAINSLKNELSSVNRNVNALIKAMDKAISESDSFIKQLKHD
ncbi:MAG: septation ring formation regulator EzrA [Oceanicoccus sp.]|jgi:septation ring formation regulator EzrA